MSEDFKVVDISLTCNMEVELHDQEELEHLVKKKIIDKKILDYNKKLADYLSPFRVEQREEQGFKSKYKKYKKDLDKISELSKADRIAILNNKFSSEAELEFKVPNCRNISAKQKKIILEGQVGK